MLGFRGAAALFGALAVTGAVIAGACSVYDPSLLLPPSADSGPPDVKEAGAPDAREAEAAPPVCPEDFPPGPPAMDDPSDAGDQTFVVALHTLNVGLGDAGVAGLGYDLDKVYTCCDGGPESCKAAVTGQAHCDQSGGRDDSAGELLAGLAKIDSAQFNTTTVSQNLESGAYSVLVQVLHYNGTPNDTSVSVALYASSGVTNDAGAAWNGSDTWQIDDAFTVNDSGAPLPNHFDPNAYVSDGTLVMHVDFPLSLGSTGTGSFEIDLASGSITATVVRSGGGYALRDGQMSGRWNVSALLLAVQALKVLGSPVCPGSNAYSLIKQQVCQYADIMNDPTQDLMGKTCDALSLGIGFTADPAILGPIVPTPPHGSLCYPDGGAPDATDQCP
ncbi:MAG TPA: hypothetical protein VF765_04380 [Polyangiaceae bacterium]